MNTTLTSVVGAHPGTRVQIAPGATLAPIPAKSVPPFALAEWVPAGDGTWRMVARVCPEYFCCTQKNLVRLGIDVSKRTMQRLIVAGFVRGQKTTPGIYQFDYASYVAHVEAVAADPDFWNKTAPGEELTNSERWRRSI